jgi:hypothetical protein
MTLKRCADDWRQRDTGAALRDYHQIHAAELVLMVPRRLAHHSLEAIAHHSL